jgi:hypothetical protein
VPEEQTSAISILRPEALILIVLTIPVILFGLYFTPLADLANASVQMFGLH